MGKLNQTMEELKGRIELESGESLVNSFFAVNLDMDSMLNVGRREPVTYATRVPRFEDDFIWDYPHSLQRGYLVLTDRRLFFIGKVKPHNPMYPTPPECDILASGLWKDIIEMKMVGRWLRVIFLQNRELTRFYFQDVFEIWEFWMDGKEHRKEISPMKLKEIIQERAEASRTI